MQILSQPETISTKTRSDEAAPSSLSVHNEPQQHVLLEAPTFDDSVEFHKRSSEVVGALKRPGKELPVIDLGFVKISGVDINSIREGAIVATIPMVKGRFEVPADFEDAHVYIKEGTHADVVINIGRDSEDRAVMTDIRMSFNKPITVTNPATSLQEPRSGWKGRLRNAIENWMADVILDGVHVSADGNIHLEGKLDKSCLGEESLPEKYPPVDMRLENYIPKQLRAQKPKSHVDDTDFEDISDILIEKVDTASESQTPLATADGIMPASKQKRLLEILSTFMKPARFTVKIAGDEMPIMATTKDAEVWSDKGQTFVELHGQASLSRRGSVEALVDLDSSKIENSLVSMQVGGEARLANPHVSKRGDARVQVRGNIRPLAGEAKVKKDITLPDGVVHQEEASVPFQISSAENAFSSQAFLHSDTGEWEMRESSSGKIDIETTLGEKVPFDVADIKVAMEKNRVRVQASATEMSFNKEGFYLRKGHGKVTTMGVDPEFNVAGFRSEIDGELRSRIVAEELTYDPVTGKPGASGRMDYEVVPSQHLMLERPELRPFGGTASYRLRKDGSLALGEAHNGLSTFVAPFVNLVGDSKKICDPKGVRIGDVGSVEMKKHMVKLTGAPIRGDNYAELLIDGVMSLPKRLEMIRNAKERIYIQALIFKGDGSGTLITDELIKAVKRGVKAYVIIDSLGNIESLEGLINDNPLYKKLNDGGVQLRLYNDAAETGLREVIDVLEVHPEIAGIKTIEDIKNPAKAIPAFNALTQIASGKKESSLTNDERVKLTHGLGLMFSKPHEKSEDVVSELAEYLADNVLDAGELVATAKRVADLNHRWHEKYFGVDGKVVIMGGLNIADEYLYGGTDKRASSMGIERVAWRDTDLYIKGPSASDAYLAFARNWKILTGEELPEPPKAEDIAVPAAACGGVEIQVIQHHPAIDGDHHTANVMIENLKALRPGEKAYFANAYFLPTGALKSLEEAMIDAKKRGADVRFLTNSKTTTDGPQINQAAILCYRRLLAAGVRIFERTGERTMHTKASCFGGKVAVIGSWNADNRSESLNSEGIAVVYNDALARQFEEMIIHDMEPDVAREIHLEDVENLPWREEAECWMIHHTIADLL